MRLSLPTIPKGNQPSNSANGQMPLQSAWWRHVKRLQEARTQPYRSMKEGRDTGTEALQRFQAALLAVRGRRNAFDKPYVYDIPATEHSADASACVYGPFTKRAVTAYQQQTKLGADGIAGQTTLKYLDAALVAEYDSTLPSSNGPGGPAQPPSNTPTISPSSTTGGV